MERLRVVEARLQQIDMQGVEAAPDVVLKSVPAQHFLALRELLPTLLRCAISGRAGWAGLVAPAVISTKYARLYRNGNPFANVHD